jgi:hypothetical protein
MASVLPPYTFNYRNLSSEKVLAILAEHGDGATSIDDIKTPEAGRKVLAALEEAGGIFERVVMPVRSLREFPLTIAEGGAQLCPAPTSVDFSSEEFNRAYANDNHAERTPPQLQYYREVEDIARAVLGPDVVHLWCIGHLNRISRDDATSVGSTAGPIKRVSH